MHSTRSAAIAGDFICYDVTSEDDARAAMAAVDAAHGRLDILVNAAGIEIEETIEDTTLDAWNRMPKDQPSLDGIKQLQLELETKVQAG